MGLNTEWLEDAECTRHDPEMFYAHENGVSGAALEVAERAAKTVCDRCGVTDECLLYALATKQGFGVWGGMTPAERDRMLSRGQEATA